MTRPPRRSTLLPSTTLFRSPALHRLELRGLLASDLDYPPAMAPTNRNGSAPVATASGSGASGDSCDRSSPQAKNRTNGRRFCRSEEHTSELQSRLHLVCRLL